MPRLQMLYKYSSLALGRHWETEIEHLVVQLKLNFTRTGGTRVPVHPALRVLTHPLND